jgi:hypothetical protein
MPYYTDDISVMEDLDPEPQPKGRGYSREFRLGVVLLVVVLLWAGWQSWQLAVQQQNYRQAEEAVSVQDWSRAYDFFISASGYRDAGARARQVEKLIQERDRHYRAATTAINRKQWVTALTELQGVLSIQAQYWDVASLYDTVKAEVYSNTLKGAIAQRSGSEAEPPGLYYRTASDWVWLEGSDRWSQVLGATSNSVAYDVPGEDWQPGATPTPVPSNRQPPPGRPELSGRRLKVATLTGSAATSRDSMLDPALYSYYLPAGDRLVAGRYNERTSSSLNAVRSGFIGWWIDYEQVEQGRAVSTTLSMGDPNETVLDVSPGTDRFLVAHASGVSMRSSKIDLYIGLEGEGGEYTRRLIYSHKGQLGGGQISPDGRYVLLTTITPLPDAISEVQSALLFDLVAQTPPYTLTTRTAQVDTVGGYVAFDTWVKGTFLTQGDYAGKLLLVEQDLQELAVNLVDPTNVGVRTELARLPGNRFLAYVAEQPGSAKLVLSGWALDGSGPASFQRITRLLFVRLVPGEEARITYVPTAEFAYLRSFGLRTGHLVYEQRTGSDMGRRLEVYSMPDSALDREHEIVPTQVYTATGLDIFDSRGTGYTAQTPSWYPGEGAFAFAQGGGLSVREYDSSSEGKLESSVLQLIDPRTYSIINYFR